MGKLAAIAIIGLLVLWVIAAVFLFIAPYVIGFIAIVIMVGLTGRLIEFLGSSSDKKSGADPLLPDSRE